MPTQEHRINIKAHRDAVFAALTSSAGWRGWFTNDVQGTLAPTERITATVAGREPIVLQILTVQPPTSASWTAIDGPFAAPGASTTVTLSDLTDGRTSVELVHETPPIPAPDLQACNTWWGVLLGQLRSYCETHQVASAL